MEIHTAESLWPDPSAFEVELTVEKLKRHKSPGIDLIPAALIKARGRTIRSKIHKLTTFIWNKEELPEEWKVLFLVPIYKKVDKMDCSDYRVISLLSTVYTILSSILLSRLTPYAEEIIGDHCGLQCNRSATDHIFCMHQILEKEWEYNEAVYQLFVDFKEAYDSVRKELFYNIIMEFGISMKLVRLIKMCLNETYNRVWVGKHMSYMFPIRNVLKQGDALLSSLFKFAFEYATRVHIIFWFMLMMMDWAAAYIL
jgi:sorting nexin-29